MKAKIQFTIDIEDVPQEVSKRLENVYFKTQSISEEIKNILSLINEENFLSCTSKIDKLRKELSFYDSVLEDSYNVLVGYTSYKTKQLEQTVEASLSQQESDEKNE